MIRVHKIKNNFMRACVTRRSVSMIMQPLPFKLAVSCLRQHTFESTRSVGHGFE